MPSLKTPSRKTPSRKTLCRALTIAVLFSGFTLVTAAETEAGIFGRSNRSSVSRGYAIRGPSPLKFRVSSASYRRLTTFYPSIYRPAR